MPATVPCGGCPAAPDGGCLSSFAKGTLLVKATAGKEKLLVKMVGGPARRRIRQSARGGGTAYDVVLTTTAHPRRSQRRPRR
jgi:hypothetical protein